MTEDELLESAAPEEPVEQTPVEVISVDDLIDRLTAVSDTMEDAAATESPEPEEPEEPAPPVEVAGMEAVTTQLTELQETLTDHPMLTTPFDDYTVTEGLLLILVLLVFLAACAKILRGGFSWLW